MTSRCITLKTSNSYWLTQKQCMKHLLATSYVLYFELHTQTQTVMLNLHIMRCFSESAAMGQMKCTGGWQLANRLVAHGFIFGPCLSSGVLVQCVKIGISVKISVCWVRSLSHDVWCECERACNDLLSVGINAGVVTASAVILWGVRQFANCSSVHRKQDVEPRTTTKEQRANRNVTKQNSVGWNRRLWNHP
jgi:hypothetical protein